MLKHLNAQALFDALPDAAIILDRTGGIKYLNPSAQNLFQYDISEIKDQSIEVLIPARFRIRHIAERENRLRAAPLLAWGPHRKLIALRKDGSECHVLVKVSSLRVDQGDWLICLVRDFTSIYEKDQEACALHHLYQNMANVLQAEEAFAPGHPMNLQVMESFHERLTSLCLNTPYSGSRVIRVKDLLESTRMLAQPHMDRVGADLIMEECHEEAAIQFSSSILLMALLGFIKICADAVACLGERWVKLGLECEPTRILLSISDSAFSVSDARILSQNAEAEVGAHLLRDSGAELVTSSVSRSRFCVSLPLCP